VEFPPQQGPAPSPTQGDNQQSSQSNNQGQQINRASIGGSMVAYIDNAIVGSQVVVRFEDDIQNLTPDLEEFAFAKCHCTSPPGPGPRGLAPNVNTQLLHLYGEGAFNRRFSLFADVPLRWVQPQGAVLGGSYPNQRGLGDVVAGFKFALVASQRRYVTFEMQTFFPSGNASKGLGTNHYSVQPSILYYQKLSDRISLESELEDWHPFGGSPTDSTPASPRYASDVLTYGIGVSYKLFNAMHVQFAPLVEFVGWHLSGGFETVPNSQNNPVGIPAGEGGMNLLNLKGGGRLTIGVHSSVYLGYGRALTGLYWYLRVMKVEYRYAF
jgi:hypothetical protein